LLLIESYVAFLGGEVIVQRIVDENNIPLDLARNPGMCQNSHFVEEFLSKFISFTKEEELLFNQETMPSVFQLKYKIEKIAGTNESSCLPDKIKPTYLSLKDVIFKPVALNFSF
jgi:hypothetical protein